MNNIPAIKLKEGPHLDGHPIDFKFWILLVMEFEEHEF